METFSQSRNGRTHPLDDIPKILSMLTINQLKNIFFMQQLHSTVQDFYLRSLQNAVIIAVGKFTDDQFHKTFISETGQNSMPELLARQYLDYRDAFDALDRAYALTRRSALTDDIADLDTEGDQLLVAFSEGVAMARRLSFDPERLKQGNLVYEFWRKYKIDARENMIAEWSKVQQACQEAIADYQLELALKGLGLFTLIQRLAAIADELRRKLTERSASLPAQQQMKQAREAFYPEYRQLILLLNAFAQTDPEKGREYETLIRALNDNIDYVRIHAVKSDAAAGGDDGNTPEPAPPTGGGAQ